jgi:hypothetical protein
VMDQFHTQERHRDYTKSAQGESTPTAIPHVPWIVYAIIRIA